MAQERIGTLSALSIGIGGMVGGGIFAVTGFTVQLTRGAAPIAFIVAGVVALLTAYSYWRLTLRFPSQGGTVEFLNRAFGSGTVTGALNILLCLSYVILLSVYAYAFGAYGAKLLPAADYEFWHHTLITVVVVSLSLLNYLSARLVIRSENFFNAAKMLLLALFIGVGLATPMDWSRLSTDEWVGPIELVSGAMIIFLNYEGFELIANASPNIDNPKRSLPIAYLGGVVIVIGFYVAISAIVVGHLDFAAIERHSDYVLSAAADAFFGPAGGVLVIVAALLATSSAINATFYSSGRLTYLIAKSGELPAELERSIHDQPLEGMILFAVLTLLVANFLPLAAIATMGSAGFLIIFFAVNLANWRLAAETGGQRWVSGVAAGACLIALFALCGQTLVDPSTRWHLWILAGMVTLSIGIESVYRALTGRTMRVHEHRPTAER
jgi:amino acid transporter